MVLQNLIYWIEFGFLRQPLIIFSSENFEDISRLEVVWNLRTWEDSWELMIGLILWSTPYLGSWLYCHTNKHSDFRTLSLTWNFSWEPMKIGILLSSLPCASAVFHADCWIVNMATTWPWVLIRLMSPHVRQFASVHSPLALATVGPMNMTARESRGRITKKMEIKNMSGAGVDFRPSCYS